MSCQSSVPNLNILEISDEEYEVSYYAVSSAVLGDSLFGPNLLLSFFSQTPLRVRPYELKVTASHLKLL